MFKINCPFCKGHSVSDVIDSIEEVDGQWECNNGHQFVVKYIRKMDIVIVLDIETTGLSPKFDMICEVGLCFLNLETGDIDPIFNIICQEENKKFDDNSWIFQNSDLRFVDVINAPYLEDFREELQGIFNLNYSCTAYNQDFDFGFLEFRDFRINQKFWDPMLKLTPVLKIPNISYYAKDYKWPSVWEAYHYFFPNEHYIETHRALDDAMHEAKIIYETYKHLKRNERR